MINWLHRQWIQSFVFLLLGSILPLASQETNQVLSQENSPPKIPLTLKQAILKNLLQQPAIRVALYNIDIQRGIAQSSAAPFDPVVNSQIFHTYSRDLLNLDQNLNSLNLGQNLTPIAGIPGANPVNMAPVIPTANQNQNPCCPSDFSCQNANANNQNTTNTNNQFVCPPPIHTNLQAHETTAHVDVSAKTREGTRILLSLDIDQYHNPIFCPRKLNVGRFSFEVDQPLLRDRHYGLDYMTELSNRQEIYAVRYDTLQTISQQVFNTISLYWDTLAGKKIVQVQKESEARLKVIVKNVKFLIKRGQLAATDLLQPLAQLSSQIVARIEAEQTLYDSQQKLKFAMGEWDELQPCERKEFEIADDFPTTSVDPSAFSSVFCHLFPAVFQQRFDILAASTREGRYTLLLKGAKNLELPQLNVVGRVTVSDFTACSKSEQLFSSLEFKHPQKDLTIGVVFSTPFYRDEAKGLIRQRQAEWAQAQAEVQLLKQQALADINAALKDLLNLQEEIKKAKAAVEEYQQLLKNEKKKLVAGYSSIFVLLSFESFLTNAMVSSIQLQNQLAKNIARLRFLTGTLIEFSPFNDCQSFLVGDAVTLPFNSSVNLEMFDNLEAEWCDDEE